MNKTAKILLSFATGALAGIVTGLLLAPDKASEKRKGSKKQQEKVEDESSPVFQKAKEHYDWVENEMHD